MKLLNIKKMEGDIKLLSGLHIGGNKDTIEIGGIDAPVIKNHINGEPYIPGSSLKGKLRTLLEYYLNKIEPDGKVWGSNSRNGYSNDDPVLRIFGTSHKKYEGGPTRLTVRDSFLIPGWRDQTLERGLLLTEEKIEVVIDRISGSAAKAGARHIERVPPGAIFKLEMNYKIFDMEDNGKTDENNLNDLFVAMKLLEQDSLGGSGSRGYGRICFQNLMLDGKSFQETFEKINIHTRENILA